MFRVDSKKVGFHRGQMEDLRRIMFCLQGKLKCQKAKSWRKLFDGAATSKKAVISRVQEGLHDNRL